LDDSIWDGTAGFVRGAVGIIQLAGGAVGAINADVGRELTGLGNAIEYSGIGVVQEMALTAGFQLRRMPEDATIYEKVAIGELSKDQLAQWLMNVPSKPNVE
jgi:hypothetical protein